MESVTAGSEKSAADLEGRLMEHVAKIIEIADGVTAKDDATAAKLQIDARKWVVETVLLKDSGKKAEGHGSTPMAVNIHTADSQAVTKDATRTP
jgi:hypothetical protein